MDASGNIPLDCVPNVSGNPIKYFFLEKAPIPVAFPYNLQQDNKQTFLCNLLTLIQIKG
jgi:hypothetical protein